MTFVIKSRFTWGKVLPGPTTLPDPSRRTATETNRADESLLNGPRDRDLFRAEK